MRPDVSRWFARRTWRGTLAPADLAARKRGQRISVVLPALNEERTVGPIVAAISRELVEATGLVDELLVMDPGSTDATAARAAAAGATVIPVDTVLPAHGSRPGKGEALWKSLHASTGELIVFVDADLTDFTPAFVTGLLTPLLTEPTVSFVKACYDRPLTPGAGAGAGAGTDPLGGGPVTDPLGGGRVTEIAARPMLNLLWPVLAGMVQPLAGEYAGRRELFERLPFASGYAVELALLLDALEAVGLDGLAQADLGVRSHRNQATPALGQMSAAILTTALARAGLDPAGLTLTQFGRDRSGAFQPATRPLTQQERPPMRTVPEYAAARARAC